MQVQATDSFEVRAGMRGVKHAPGVVLVFDAAGFEHNVPTAGETVHLVLPDGGGEQVVVIGEVKKHGTVRSFYFEGLTIDRAPVGTMVEWVEGKRKATAGARRRHGVSKR